jgi:hypothetical protein
MTPILGILASAISGNLWAPGKDYDSIATTTVGAGGASSITFSSIPSTYRHLQIRFIGRITTGSWADFQLTFNGSGTGYTRHQIEGDGASATAYGAASQTRIVIASGTTGSTQTAGVFGAGVTDILDYANTNKYKTVRSLSGGDNNGSGYVDLQSGLWMDTTAVSSITIQSGVNTLAQYTQAALYGIKG